MLSSLAIALSMYSSIPMPRVEWRDDNMRWSLGCLPVVGVLAGGLVAVWSWVTLPFGIAPALFAAVAVFLPLLLSGGFHMDGFLDASDAIFSRRDRQRKLEIMKDPCCGPFAVLSCGGLLLLEFAAWSQLFFRPGLIPVACCVFLLSRSLTVAAGSFLTYAPTSSLGALFASRSASGVRYLGVAEIIISAAALLLSGWLGAGFWGLLAAGLALAAAGFWFLWYVHMVRKQFGGVTGDLLGYLVESSQFFMLLTIALAGVFIPLN